MPGPSPSDSRGNILGWAVVVLLAVAGWRLLRPSAVLWDNLNPHGGRSEIAASMERLDQAMRVAGSGGNVFIRFPAVADHPTPAQWRQMMLIYYRACFTLYPGTALLTLEDRVVNDPAAVDRVMPEVSWLASHGFHAVVDVSAEGPLLIRPVRPIVPATTEVRR